MNVNKHNSIIKDKTTKITIDLNKVPEIKDSDNPIIVYIKHRKGFKVDVTQTGILNETKDGVTPFVRILFTRNS